MSLKYVSKLQNQRVLVLGGTSGIGFCVAENAVEHGAIVIVASSQQASIDKTLSRLTASYPERTSNIFGRVIDLRSDDSEKAIVELLKFATNNGENLLDHIVSTAGDSVAIQPLDKFTGAEQLADAQRVRILTPMFLAKRAPDVYLQRSNRSSMTFTGGVNTHRPAKGWEIPAMGGGSLQGLVRALAVDLKPIRVNLIEPGAIETELFRRTAQGDALEAYRQKFRDMSLTGEMGTPEDMSEAYIYAMKDAFLTGQCILSEGGLLLASRT